MDPSRRVKTPLADLRSSPGVTMLGAFQELIGDAPFSSLLTAAGIRIFSCVVDTNILVNEVRLAARTGTVPYMVELAHVGSLRLFASTRIRDEVPRVLVNMASQHGFEPADALRAWSLISPWITFLDSSGLPRSTRRIKRLALVDPDDIPTGQIVELLDPDLLLTADRAFAEFGPSLRRVPAPMRTARIAYRDKRTRDILHTGMGIGGSIMLAVIGELISPIISALKKPVSRIPKHLLILILAGLAAAASQHVLHQRRIGAIAEARHLPEPSFAAHLFRELGGVTQAGTKADRFLSSIERPHGQARSTVAHAARVLSRSPGPVGIDWLMIQMRTTGYRPRVHGRRAVERRLRVHSQLFVRMRNGRWTLRTSPAPAPGAVAAR